MLNASLYIRHQAHHGRINATSVQLEGSRHGSGGARVDVDLSHMKGQSYSLFPGQIVAVEGINASGRKLVAQRICEGAPYPPVQSSVQELLQFHYTDQEGAPLRIIAASGPFTCSTNLDYEPWIDLLNRIMIQKPDVVILTGPFVDMNHSVVQAGQTTLRFENPDGISQEDLVVPYESFFAAKISGAIEDLLAAEDGPRHIQFVLVPSLDDATTDWVYPQPPFTESHTLGTFLPIAGGGDVTVGTLGLGSIGERHIHCLSNPCTFRINEVVFGVTATDVLFHMSAEETNAHLEAGSRMNRIAQHLLQQRSYYPLFPAGGNTQLNLQFMEQWQMPCAPDILICPSKLAPFASPLLDGNTLVLNPGSLARAHAGGSFAALEIHPLPRTTLDEAGGPEVLLPHQVVQRTHVEIRKI
jgi:DNA polymerase alpha subunit B